MRNIYRARVRGDMVPKDEAAAVAELEAFLEKAPPETQYHGARVLLDDHPTYSKVGVVRPVEGERWLGRAAVKSSRAAEYQKIRREKNGTASPTVETNSSAAPETPVP